MCCLLAHAGGKANGRHRRQQLRQQPPRAHCCGVLAVALVCSCSDSWEGSGPRISNALRTSSNTLLLALNRHGRVDPVLSRQAQGPLWRPKATSRSSLPGHTHPRRCLLYQTSPTSPMRRTYQTSPLPMRPLCQTRSLGWFQAHIQDHHPSTERCHRGQRHPPQAKGMTWCALPFLLEILARH